MCVCARGRERVNAGGHCPRVRRVNSCCRFLQRRSYLVLFTSPSFHGANVSVSPPRLLLPLSSPQYAVWVTLWVAWNVFIICFYLDVGGLSKVRLSFSVRFLSGPSARPPSHGELPPTHSRHSRAGWENGGQTG